MIKKMAVFIVLAILVLPIASSAQSTNRSGRSIVDVNIADIPEGSIVVLSTEDTEVPGYIHQRYAYNCFGTLQLVDYYGSTFDPKDASYYRGNAGYACGNISIWMMGNSNAKYLTALRLPLQGRNVAPQPNYNKFRCGRTRSSFSAR